MKKIKSILALLLMGGLIVTGCDKKNNDASSGDGDGTQQNDGAPSNNNNNGGNNNGGNNNGGNNGQNSQARFAGYKLVVEDIDTEPADKKEAVLAMYANAYLCFFEAGASVEMIIPLGEEHYEGILGTYALSADGNTATITAVRAYISQGNMHATAAQLGMDPVAVTYNAQTSKYSMSMEVEGAFGEANATFKLQVGGEAVSKNIPEPPVLAWPTDDIAQRRTIWGIEHDTVPALADLAGITSISVQPVLSSFTAESSYFSLSINDGYSKLEAYKETLVAAGYTLKTEIPYATYESTNQELQIMVTGSAEYDILAIMVYKIVPATVTYYVLMPSWATDDSAILAAWVWGGEDTGHWELLDPEVEDDHLICELELQPTIVGMKILRLNPAAAVPAPEQYSSTYGTNTDAAAWNSVELQVSDFDVAHSTSIWFS